MSAAFALELLCAGFKLRNLEKLSLLGFSCLFCSAIVVWFHPALVLAVARSVAGSSEQQLVFREALRALAAQFATLFSDSSTWDVSFIP